VINSGDVEFSALGEHVFDGDWQWQWDTGGDNLNCLDVL